MSVKDVASSFSQRVQRAQRFLERHAMTAVRFALGWHLAYMGVWALTSTYDYSWAGCFRCAHWLFGDALRAIGDSAAMGVVDAGIAWGLLIAGVLLMLGRLVRPAAVFGLAYLALMYLLNPPHFGHTGESHFMYIDRNVIEMVLLFCVMAIGREGAQAEVDNQKPETRNQEL